MTCCVELRILGSISVAATLIVQLIALFVPAWLRSRVESTSGLELWTNIGPVLGHGCIKVTKLDPVACDTMSTETIISWFMFLFQGPLNETSETMVLGLKVLMAIAVVSAVGANIVRCYVGKRGYLLLALLSAGISGILSFAAATSAISFYKTIYFEPEYTIQKNLLYEGNIRFLFPWSTIVAYFGTFLAIISIVLITKEQIRARENQASGQDRHEESPDVTGHTRDIRL